MNIVYTYKVISAMIVEYEIKVKAHMIILLLYLLTKNGFYNDMRKVRTYKQMFRIMWPTLNVQINICILPVLSIRFKPTLDQMAIIKRYNIIIMQNVLQE